MLFADRKSLNKICLKMKDCNIRHCKQKYLIRSGWSFSMPSSRIVTDTPKPGVVKTKSKGSCVNRSTYLSHRSNLHQQQNWSTHLWLPGSKHLPPSCSGRHVWWGEDYGDEDDYGDGNGNEAKNYFDFGPVQVPHVLPHWVVHLRPWLKKGIS